MWYLINSYTKSALELKFPNICLKMSNTNQDKLWHEEGDVFTHTLMVISSLEKVDEFSTCTPQEQEILKAAAFLHDMAKPITTKEEDGRIISPNHSKLGEKLARGLLYNLDTPFLIREQITQLVRYHGYPIWFIDKNERDFLRISWHVNTKLLYILAKADFLGRISKVDDDKIFNVELFKEECKIFQCFGSRVNFKNEHAMATFFHSNKSVLESLEYIPFQEPTFTVTLMSALPGSGKDYYINSKKIKNIISLDQMRLDQKIKRGDKKAEGRMYQAAKEQAKVYLRSKTDFVWNATNTSKDMRSKLISLFYEYGARVEIVYIEVPLKKLLNQNKNREHSIPESSLYKMIQGLDVPTAEEAHKTIYIV